MEDLDVSGLTSFSQIRDVNEAEIGPGRRESFKLTRKGKSLFEEIEDNNYNNKPSLNKQNSKRMKANGNNGKGPINKSRSDKKKAVKRKTSAGNGKKFDNISLIHFLEVNSPNLASDDDKTFLSGDDEENGFSLSPVKPTKKAKSSSAIQTKSDKDSKVQNTNKKRATQHVPEAVYDENDDDNEEQTSNFKEKTGINRVVKDAIEEEDKANMPSYQSKSRGKSKRVVIERIQETDGVKKLRSSKIKTKPKKINDESNEDNFSLGKVPMCDELIDENKGNGNVAISKDHLETFNVPLKDDPKSFHQTMKSHEIGKIVKQNTPRRSSLSFRGKRLSSIKGSTVLPHDSIPLVEFHKHLDPNLPTPHKLKTLLIWICKRLLKSESGKDKKRVEKLLSMIQSNSLDINWWGQDDDDEEEEDEEIKNRIQFLKGQCFEFDEELTQLKNRENSHLGELNYDINSDRISVERFIGTKNENELKLINERVETFELVMNKTKIISDLTDKVLEFKKDLIIQELRKSIEVDSISLLKMLFN